MTPTPEDPFVAALRCLLDQAAALELQARAMRGQAATLLAASVEHGAVEDEDDASACPRCGEKKWQAPAGDVVVCGECGANYREGKVVDG